MGASNWVHVDVAHIVRATENALLVEIDGEEIWLPRSQVSDGESYEVGDTNVTLSITEWLARRRGLGE